MEIVYSEIFKNFPRLRFGFSTKIGLKRSAPFYFNMSHTVGDLKERVEENRTAFFSELGIAPQNVAIQKQTHSDIIKLVEKPGLIGQSDAMITKVKEVALAVSAADCTPIFIYDHRNEVIAAVHAGWRGTKNEILKKTLTNLAFHFQSVPEELFVYIGPSISQKNYEVGSEVALQFDQKYIMRQNGKLFLDVASQNYDTLISFGVPPSNIERLSLCTFEEEYLQSYRREKEIAGRAFGVIFMGNGS